jgi:hypothetical protein
MKSILTQAAACGAVLLLVVVASSGADADTALDGGSFPPPELVQISSQGLYAPPMFDDNEPVEVVVHGALAGTCYKIAQPKVSISRADRLITIVPQAFRYTSRRCLDMSVSFTQSIDLGLLSQGHYRVLEYGPGGKPAHETSFSVEPSISDAPDDFLYAPVTGVRADFSQTPPAMILTGEFSSNCMELQETRVLHRAAHVIEVLPVAAYKGGSSCHDDPRSFKVRVNLPPIEPGTTLIHVRSLSGAALDDIEVL